MVLFLRPAIAAFVSSSPPRDVLMIITPFFIRAMRASLMQWCVSLVIGACSEMMSHRLHSSSSVTYSTPLSASSLFTLRDCAMTLQPKPRKMFAAITPILPVPMMPTVRPCMSKPVRPRRLKLPSRFRKYAL
jgi:hypothetical protein